MSAARLLLLVPILIMSWSPCSCLSRDLALKLADGLMARGAYEDAVTEYKRFISHNPQSDSLSYAYYNMGLAYRNREDWDAAARAFRAASGAAPSDSVVDVCNLAAGITLIAQGAYSGAEYYLLKVQMFSRFPGLRRRARFFHGVALVYSHRWVDADEAFDRYFNTEDGGQAEVGAKLDSLLESAKTADYKSPSTAKWLSTILPGSGHMYVGDWWDGINALTLNATVAYGAVNTIGKGDYVRAGLIYFTLFRGFFFGSRSHAENAARNYNDRLGERHRTAILRLLSSQVGVNP